MNCINLFFMIEVKLFFVIGLVLLRCVFFLWFEDNFGSFCRNVLFCKGFFDNLYVISFSLFFMGCGWLGLFGRYNVFFVIGISLGVLIKRFISFGY